MSETQRCPFCGKIHEEAMRLNGLQVYACEKTPSQKDIWIWDPTPWMDAIKNAPPPDPNRLTAEHGRILLERIRSRKVDPALVFPIFDDGGEEPKP